jgi:hypothetical protein
MAFAVGAFFVFRWLQGLVCRGVGRVSSKIYKKKQFISKLIDFSNSKDIY